MPRRIRKPATNPRLSDAQIVEMTGKFETLKAEAAVAEKEAKAIQKAILEEMKERGVEQIEWASGRVTRTAAKTITIDVDVLRELIPVKVFRRVTEPKVNKTLLSAAIQDGTLDASLVAKATTEGENAPYIRVSHGTGD